LGSILVPMMLLALGARRSQRRLADVGAGVRASFLIADRFGIQPEKAASIVLVGRIGSLALLPAGLWLALREKDRERKIGAPGATRTRDLQLRRLTLYPTELRALTNSGRNLAHALRLCKSAPNAVHEG
jgi:hypothetical protein